MVRQLADSRATDKSRTAGKPDGGRDGGGGSAMPEEPMVVLALKCICIGPYSERSEYCD